MLPPLSKGKAIAFTAIALVFALLCLPAQIYGCFFPFLLIALVFGAVAYAKQRRDTQIIGHAEQEQRLIGTQLPVQPPMTSKGSSRLFVPPPLQKRT